MNRSGQNSELREKMAVVKNLYCSRHYTQCAKLGELLLSEAHDETHPLHLAHLNFYTALSHDTLAREATMKNQRKELMKAEKHYLAAINVLSQPEALEPERSFQQKTQHEIQQEVLQDSPKSVFSDLVFPWQRRGSDDSLQSSASSASSIYSDDYRTSYEVAPKPQSPSSPTASTTRLTAKTVKRHDSAAALSFSPPLTSAQTHFSTNVTSFIRMLERHLAEVYEMDNRASIPTIHFTTPSLQSPPMSPHFSPAASRDSTLLAESAMEAVRQRRRSVVFRPRFDPTSIRMLCSEAMAELAD